MIFFQEKEKNKRNELNVADPHGTTLVLVAARFFYNGLVGMELLRWHVSPTFVCLSLRSG